MSLLFGKGEYHPPVSLWIVMSCHIISTSTSLNNKICMEMSQTGQNNFQSVNAEESRRVYYSVISFALCVKVEPIVS